MNKLILFLFVLCFVTGVSVCHSQVTVPMEKVKQSAFEPDSVFAGIPDTNSSAPGNLTRMARSAGETQDEISLSPITTESLPQNGNSILPVDGNMKKTKDE